MSLVDAYGDSAVLTHVLAQRYHDLMLAAGSRDTLMKRMQQTVLLWGRKGGMLPFDNVQGYLRAIPESRLIAKDGVGHLPQEESPGPSAQIVRKFLSDKNKEPTL